jgi:LCP family protein required for cell wall assembly
MPTQLDKEDITKLNRANPEQKHGFQKNFNRTLTVFILIVLCILSYFLFMVVSTSGQVFTNSDEPNCTNWFCNVKNGITKLPQMFGGSKLKGQSEGRTNILVLGVDATGESGLSDTILIASLYHNEKKIVTVNIPRDTLAEYKGKRSKINELYGDAESFKPGSGPTELATFLSKEFNIDIQYWALTNFEGSEKLVDIVGGVDVDVDNSFTDCEYPSKFYTYLPCQSFTKGIESMDGQRALIYARSRHGDNGEGSDFARSRRQSIVIQSLLQKVKNQNVFQNLSKFTEILNLLGSNVRTNLTPGELKSLVNFGREIDLKTSFLRVNWSVGNGFLCDTQDQSFGYYIYYCPDKDNSKGLGLNTNGQVMGTKPLVSTKAKGLAQKSIQNLLDQAIIDRLAGVEVAIFGNGSKSAQKLYNIMSDTESIPAFSNVSINNFYTKIPVTPTPEKITVYILDKNLEKTIVERLDDNTNSTYINYTVKNELDPKVVLPTKNQTAKVIFWLE